MTDKVKKVVIIIFAVRLSIYLHNSAKDNKLKYRITCTLT